MALRTFTPPVRQSPGTKIKPTVKKLSAEFGDGYTQESPDGINNVRDNVDLVWDTLLPDQAKAMEIFMKEHKGVIPFYYDVDEGEMRRWKCEVWDRTRGSPFSFSATFVEYFGQEI